MRPRNLSSYYKYIEKYSPQFLRHYQAEKYENMGRRFADQFNVEETCRKDGHRQSRLGS